LHTLNLPALTAQQEQAVAARGNVLVVAGAGTGKTRTLVERCLAWLLDEGNQGSVDEILMVTFTQAAAAEMRQRLRQGLERAQSSSPRLAEQLALLETAHISTLHSFCFQLVSQHFYELGLDPQVTVMSNEEAHLLARRTMDAVLEDIYNSDKPEDLAIQRLIQAQGGDWDQPVRDLIGRLHRYAQTLRDPAAWFAAQTAGFQSEEPVQWRAWLMAELKNWRRAWLPVLRGQPKENENAARCAAALERVNDKATRAEFAAALARLREIDQSWPRPKARWRDPIKDLFEEADFLLSVCAMENGSDPLAEDWNWARASMLALLEAAGRFGAAFAQAKRNAGALDFQDLEQFALRLLWEQGSPSAIARQWRQKLRLIFVDEFQDINGAQEAIIRFLAREGAEANCFLVGDVKQSIYRFRLADPRIFVKYNAQWAPGGPAGRVLGLSENFRSHEGILSFVNALFASLMRESIGGVNYDEEASLRPGLPPAISSQSSLSPPVELLLRRLGESREEDEEGASDAEKEARLVGRRLAELRAAKTLILDAGRPRAVTWSDMVVLLRAPRHKTAAYAKEFSRLGIPLAAARGGFYDSAEARDLLAVLQLLDNPLQDLPLLAVLRSPLAGLTPAELAAIRVARPHGLFWNALVDWQRQEARKDPAAGPVEKAGRFLDRFRAWRRLARRKTVSHCLENVIDTTHYADWLQTQERAGQRRANVERLLQLARQFDAARGESLPRFLRFVEAQQESEADTEPAAAPETDAVRLMSIHQSKGLEFPVVVVADLGKRFNVADLGGNIILDEQFGLCPRVRPANAFQSWPSLPYWLARRRQKCELLGEEMRLLYVALTRAAQRLILAGAASRKSIEDKWPKCAGRAPAAGEILAGASYLDWLGSWPPGAASLQSSGQNEFFNWTVFDDDHPWLATGAGAGRTSGTAGAADDLDLSAEARERLDWRYPFGADTGIPAKASVSGLRREMAGESEEEAAPMFAVDSPPAARRTREAPLTAAEIGSAHHIFLERMALEPAPTAEGLREEAARLHRLNLLTTEECASLDLEALAAFWQSAPGRDLLDRRTALRRELAFTARLAAAELAHLGATEFANAGADEFVVVQGVIDLAAILPDEIWLLDFKTDHFPAAELGEKIRQYRPQIELYAAALSRIHGRPVTRRWLHFLSHRHTAAV
jgi:ATP-dependent helicase/nuclease subunit A